MTKNPPQNSLPTPSDPDEEKKKEERRLKVEFLSALLHRIEEYATTTKKFRDKSNQQMVDGLELAERVFDKWFIPLYWKNDNFRAYVRTAGMSTLLDHPQWRGWFWRWLKWGSADLLDAYYKKFIQLDKYVHFLFLHLASKRLDGMLFPLIANNPARDEQWIVKKLVERKNTCMVLSEKGVLRSVCLTKSGHKNLEWLVDKGYLRKLETNDPDRLWRYEDQAIEADGVKILKRVPVTLKLTETARDYIFHSTREYNTVESKDDNDAASSAFAQPDEDSKNNLISIFTKQGNRSRDDISLENDQSDKHDSDDESPLYAQPGEDDNTDSDWITILVKQDRIPSDFIEKIFNMLVDGEWLSAVEAEVSRLMLLGEEPDYKPLAPKQAASRFGVAVKKVEGWRKKFEKVLKDPELHEIIRLLISTNEINKH